MSAELMHKMNPYGYKKFCAFISECDSISLDFYKASKWVNYFALDISLTFKNGKVNPDHIYELFGNFDGLSAQEVRLHLLEYIYENTDFFECRSSVCLPLQGVSMNMWVEMVEDIRICCEELALLGLSAMYQRHCVVVTKNKFWSTIETKELLSIINLMKECSVRLLYLGNLKFGTLCWQPRNPQPAKPNLGQFKIIEEYTLDEPTTLGESSTADNGVEEHVETTAPFETSPSPTKPSTSGESPMADNMAGEHVETATPPKISTAKLVDTETLPDSTPSTAETLADDTELSPIHVGTLTDTTPVKVEMSLSNDSKDKTSIPNLKLKDLKIVLPRLTDSDPGVQSTTTHSHVETELKPVITSVQG